MFLASGGRNRADYGKDTDSGKSCKSMLKVIVTVNQKSLFYNMAEREGFEK
jgi:hypothetical protein